MFGKNCNTALLQMLMDTSDFTDLYILPSVFKLFTYKSVVIIDLAPNLIAQFLSSEHRYCPNGQKVSMLSDHFVYEWMKSNFFLLLLSQIQSKTVMHLSVGIGYPVKLKMPLADVNTEICRCCSVIFLFSVDLNETLNISLEDHHSKNSKYNNP